MKDIEHFLPFYLGCTVEATHKTKSQSYQGTLKYVGSEFIGLEYPQSESVKKVMKLLFAFNKIKPFLRPFLSMTDEEAIEVFKLALDTREARRLTVHRLKDEGVRVIIVVEMFKGPLKSIADLEKHPYDWIEIDQGFTVREGRNTLCNQPEITRLLLKNELDVFELIEDGLAIDKTTLNI